MTHQEPFDYVDYLIWFGVGVIAVLILAGFITIVTAFRMGLINW